MIRVVNRLDRKRQEWEVMVYEDDRLQASYWTKSPGGETHVTSNKIRMSFERTDKIGLVTILADVVESEQ